MKPLSTRQFFQIPICHIHHSIYLYYKAGIAKCTCNYFSILVLFLIFSKIFLINSAGLRIYCADRMNYRFFLYLLGEIPVFFLKTFIK